jgi:hypothetical protein
MYAVGAKHYFTDLWNFLNALSLGLSHVSLVYQFRMIITAEDKLYEISVFNALVIPLFFFEILEYLEGFDATGPLVRMILKIVGGIKWFVLIIFMAIVFFSCSFVVLFQDAEVDAGFNSIDISILHVYGFLYGAYSADTMREAQSPNTAVFLGSIFMFFVCIVMLNMLISLMGDKHDEAQTNARSEFNFGRAKLILQYENLISRRIKLKNIDKWYPRYLQILKRSVTEDINVDWSGKVKAIQSTVSSLDRKIKDKFNEVGKKFESIDEKLDTIMRLVSNGRGNPKQFTEDINQQALADWFRWLQPPGNGVP